MKEKNIKKIAFNIVEYSFLAAVSCVLVFAAVLVINSPAINENGQGGLETSAIPISLEKEFAEIDDEISLSSEENENYELSYFSYRVRPGDMVGIIADQFDITQDTIISVNNIKSSRLLQIGAYLKIPSMPGILYTVRNDGETINSISEKYSIDAIKCSAVNNFDESVSLPAGTMVFVPDAKLDWVTRQEINGDLFKKPIRAKWYLSSSFGWRASPFSGARSYHGGVDMACPQGTLIYAAMPGVVAETGFNNTYGNYVIISHHSGYKTLYGHMSLITTVRGQVVSQDTKIGRVGSTGLSTGPHLHFAVFKNGKQVNPVNLWN